MDPSRAAAWETHLPPVSPSSHTAFGLVNQLQEHLLGHTGPGLGQRGAGAPAAQRRTFSRAAKSLETERSTRSRRDDGSGWEKPPLPGASGRNFEACTQRSGAAARWRGGRGAGSSRTEVMSQAISVEETDKRPLPVRESQAAAGEGGRRVKVGRVGPQRGLSALSWRLDSILPPGSQSCLEQDALGS